jgi:hypothetical protein
VTTLLDGTTLLPCARDPREWDNLLPPLARRRCLHCRRRVSCQAQAIGGCEEHGMWGGLTAYQARKVRQVLDRDRVPWPLRAQWWLTARQSARDGVLIAAGINPRTYGGDERAGWCRADRWADRSRLVRVGCGLRARCPARRRAVRVGHAGTGGAR